MVNFAIFTLGNYLPVEKDLFIKILQNYPASTVEEAQEFLSLKESFPYSQLLHVLSARASKDHGFSHQQNELQLAAIYSADRAILKTMMTGQVYGQDVTNGSSPQIVNPSGNLKDKNSPVVSASEALPGANAQEVQNESDDLADKVIRDVKELYETRHNFEVMFVDNPGVTLISSTPLQAGDGTEQGKSKRERIIELSKALSAQNPETEETKPVKKRRENRKDLIDEIVDTKIEIEPENEKQKEQLEIIDHFIKAQPSISNSKDKPINVQGGDLSTIKTGEFGDNIVSETLVELLLKQGKKDKAVEVLKKLIWKFPQKKAYFAAQIEELKK